MQVTEWAPGIVRIDLPVRDELRNLSGVVHGGVLAALIDFAGSMSGTHPQVAGHWPDNVISLSMSVNFIRPARGEVMHVCGRASGGGRSIFMSTIEVHDPSGLLVATGQGAFKILHPSAAGGSDDIAGRI